MARDESVLIPDTSVITIGEGTYPVQKFCLAKSLKMLAAITEISEKADLASVVADGQAYGWVAAAVRGLPRLVAVAQPQVYQVMALALMPNKRFFELIETEADLGEELRKEAKKLMMNEALDFDKMFEILQVAYERIGLESLKGNFQTLLAKVAPTATPAAEPEAELAEPEGETPTSG